MREYLVFVLVVASFVFWGPKNSMAEQRLPSTYDLGDGYALKLGKKAAELNHGRNIVGLKKDDVATDGDSLVFTLTRPEDDFGGDGTSFGVVYTKPLQENVTSNLSLTGGPADNGGGQDVAVMFHVRVELE